jgi:hypothetical protein
LLRAVRDYSGLLPQSPFDVLKQQREKPMSKHDLVTKRKRRPKSDRRVDYTSRTMAALKELAQAAKLRESQKPLPKSV